MTRFPSVIVLTAALCVPIGVPAASGSDWQCTVKPIKPCTKRHGRLSSQNGIGLKIWLIGTKRVVALENGFENLPGLVQKYLQMTSPDHSYIFGDFEICPVEPDRPGHIRRVCVSGAEKLVVQPLRSEQPPFRLLSTWPPETVKRLDEKEAVDRAKGMIVRSLDGTLPDRTLELWLRDLFGTGAKTTWEVNDCGEQTGDPQRDRGRDFPMCVDATVSLTDNRVLHVLLAVGTFKTGVRPATPAFSYGVVLQAGVPIRWLKALGEATAISRSADRTGARR